MAGLEERIRSRLGWGLVVDIHPTTYELRREILQMKARMIAEEVVIPDAVLDFLARRITSNVRELEGAQPDRGAATLVGRAITLDMAQDVLQDLLRAHERRVTIEEIKASRRALQDSPGRHAVGAPRAPWPGRARWRCTWPSS